MTTLVSPGVQVIEQDQTLRVPTFTSSVGALVVHSQKGPLNTVVDITSRSDYVDVFGTPDDVNFKFFWTAIPFLEGSNQLKVVRIEDSETGAAGVTIGTASVTGSITDDLRSDPNSKKAELYPLSYDDITANSQQNDDLISEGVAPSAAFGEIPEQANEMFHFFAIGAGDYYEQIAVSMITAEDYVELTDLKEELAQAVLDEEIQEILYRYYTGMNSPSTTATGATAVPNQLNPNLATDLYGPDDGSARDGVGTLDPSGRPVGWAIDEGLLAAYTALEYGPRLGENGQPSDEFVLYVFNERGDIAETYIASVDPEQVDDFGNRNFGPDLVNGNSNYVYFFVGANELEAPGVQPVSTGKVFLQGADPLTGYRTLDTSYTGFGKRYLPPQRTINDLTGEIIQAWLDHFTDKESITIDILLDADYVTPVKQCMDRIAKTLRKDSWCILNIPENVFLNTSTRRPLPQYVTKMKQYVDVTLNINSSYSSIYGNYAKIFDPYEEKERWVPMAGYVGKQVALTDRNFAQWFAPAGLTRGIIDNVLDIAVNPSQAERDILYPARINPIIRRVGQGISIWGQKTLQARPSAFDRINVRRLFLFVERRIEALAQFFLFELNDSVTRNRFKNLTDNFLTEIKARRGIFDFLVVADETINTPQVIDRNEFIAQILIKPTRVIEFITLVFTAVATDVSFSEFVGRF